jgi:hypothetical protein
VRFGNHAPVGFGMGGRGFSVGGFGDFVAAPSAFTRSTSDASDATGTGPSNNAA